MFFEKLSKLLGNLFHTSPKYVTVSVAQAVSGPAQALPPSKLPRHVAIIMDGNGRWATGRNLPRSAGHAAGTEALRDIIRASDDWGIEALSLYAFSTENWARSKEEVDALMGLLLKYFTSEIDELDEKHVRITILGDVDGMPQPQREALINAMNRTRDNTGLKLNIALNYGGRAELTRAARLLAEQVKAGELNPEDITEELFADSLYTKGLPDVDLLIRTSGEMRTSNFLPWQLTYAEMVFDPVNWPDFDRAHYLRCLRTYAERDRRFGGVTSEDKPTTVAYEDKAVEQTEVASEPVDAPVEAEDHVTAEEAIPSEDASEPTEVVSESDEAPAEKENSVTAEEAISSEDAPEPTEVGEADPSIEAADNPNGAPSGAGRSHDAPPSPKADDAAAAPFATEGGGEAHSGTAD